MTAYRPLNSGMSQASPALMLSPLLSLGTASLWRKRRQLVTRKYPYVSGVETKWHSLEANKGDAVPEPFVWQTKQGNGSGDPASGDAQSFVLHCCARPSSEKQAPCLAVLQMSCDTRTERSFSFPSEDYSSKHPTTWPGTQKSQNIQFPCC